MDPEGSGPDTHFKVLVAVSRALEEYVRIHGEDVAKDARVRIPQHLVALSHRGSRAHRAHLPELLRRAGQHVQLLLHQPAHGVLPIPELNGTFSELAQKIWVEQHNDLAKLLGGLLVRESASHVRRAYGAIYLKDMTYPEFRAERNRCTGSWNRSGR